MSLEFDIVTKYLGVPYKHRGRDIDGLDCWGLIKCVYKDLGHDLLDIESYDKDWSEKGADFFVENYHLQWEKVEHPTIFDVALFRNIKGVVCHAGLSLREGNILHCSERTGVVIIKSRSVNNGRTLDGFYRLKAI